jgi:hypothetical protein
LTGSEYIPAGFVLFSANFTRLLDQGTDMMTIRFRY